MFYSESKEFHYNHFKIHFFFSDANPELIQDESQKAEKSTWVSISMN